MKTDFFVLKTEIMNLLNTIEKNKNNLFDLYFSKEDLFRKVTDLHQLISQNIDNWCVNNITNNAEIPNEIVFDQIKNDFSFYAFQKHENKLAHVFGDEKIYILPKLKPCEFSYNKKEEQKYLRIISEFEKFSNMSSLDQLFYLYKWRIWNMKKIKKDKARFLDLYKEAKEEIDKVESSRKIYMENKDKIIGIATQWQKQLETVFISWGLSKQTEPTNDPYLDNSDINIFTFYKFILSKK